jgi:hypothetical protein
MDMLARSPPLPIAIDYFDEDWDITAEDEEGIMLALEQQDRVRRVRLGMPVTNLQRLIMAIDQEYPVLESLIILPPTENKSTAFKFPETLQAPQLRHLVLGGFALPIRSQLLTTAMGLVTLYLSIDHPSAYFQPNALLQWISLMPQLETLLIMFLYPIPNRDVERQLMRTPIITQVILPNLRWLGLQGASTYMEAVVCRITTPLLEQLQIQFFNQLTFSVPRLMQFMNTTENLRFDSANFKFSSDEVYVVLYLRHRERAKMYALSTRVYCCHFDWQVSSVAQIFNSVAQIFSTVEYLTLEHEEHSESSEDHDEVDRAEWHRLLRSLGNVKTLHVDDGLVKELSHILRLDDGELPLELLPNLQELTYSGSGDTGDAFASFIVARQNAGHPVTLVRLGPPRSVSPVSNRSSSIDMYVRRLSTITSRSSNLVESSQQSLQQSSQNWPQHRSRLSPYSGHSSLYSGRSSLYSGRSSLYSGRSSPDLSRFSLYSERSSRDLSRLLQYSGRSLPDLSRLSLYSGRSLPDWSRLSL